MCFHCVIFLIIMKLHITKKQRIIIGILGLVLFAGIVMLVTQESDTGTDSVESTDNPVVRLTSAQMFTNTNSATFVGTVRAASEATLTAEKTGRVTSVPVSLGQYVAAGQIIATIENSREYASVLQAEGSYDGAVAAASQSTVGVAEAQTRVTTAENDIRNTLANAYATTNSIVQTNIDQFFSNPTGSIPGLRIDGKGFTFTLNDSRIALQTTLPAWQRTVSGDIPVTELQNAANTSLATIDDVTSMIDSFITIFATVDPDSRYSQSDLTSFSSTFNSLRSTLTQQKSAITNSLAALENAEQAAERASIGAPGAGQSAADAQVKQALGSLRAAQSDLAKTIIRSPISGIVNTLDVRVGDFVSQQQAIGEVAGSGSLEVVTAVTAAERTLFTPGSTVLVDGTLEGVVTAVASGISDSTGKIEVRIRVDEAPLTNGETVTIATQDEVEVASDTRVFIPLSAVKFTQSDGAVFIVEESILVERPVAIGLIRGNSVEITDGLTFTESFVADARGLTVGTVVDSTQ